MAAIETAVGNIRDALKKVNQLMTKTWVGSAADKWATDFNGRMGSLSRLFDSFPDEEQKLIAKAQKDQANLDSKYHGHS
ncbi:hypothetical protein [Streptantibioticus ferralitis]|uniref:WXG100 family type VII secretion target n=1 Tax=Streptantibioticus ferralitis TaxID=236510 RepID=A0ABT5Z3K6_9ACTN|nr:hypothetical protein [Streptantibioticus ferralitis]MDF2258413.1 hypothetical protein [Streptantibioticus ferralitis]